MTTTGLRRGDLVAPAVAGLLAALATALRWRGADWPAQLHRVDLVARGGSLLWSTVWFGGHHLPGYGVMFPVLAARVGATSVAILSCVVAATCFQSLAEHPQRWRAVAASTLFAAGTVVNVAVGRLTFALGLAVGLAALAALRRDHRIVGAALVVATPLASPVAGVMLALALVVVAVHERRWRPALLAAAAMVPIAVAAVAFPEGGRFPFRPAAVAWTLVAVSAVAVVTDRRVVRLGAVAYAVACMATFVVANPLGANVTRLGMFVAAPLVVLTARPRRVAIAALAVPALIWWQWSPALDGIARAGRDPSSVAAYHEPLVAAVASFGPLDGRVEVVPTRRHWETVYVASEVPLARGWERQLDIGRNAIFYEDDLDRASYHRWLLDNAVRYVALADVALDPSAGAEAELVRGRPAYLQAVWRNEHWVLYRVVDARPLVEGPARLVRSGPADVVLDVTGPGPVLVRVRWSSHWSLDAPGCVDESPDGWTELRSMSPGRVTLRPVLARSLPIIGSLDGCPD